LDWLANYSEDVVSLDLLTYSGNLRNLDSLRGEPRHTFVHGDIGDSRLVADLLVRHAPRAIVNFAAESHVDRSIAGPAVFVETNIAGTFRLLEAVRGVWQQSPPAQREAFRFLHVSTDEVYGSLGRGDPAFTEQHPYRPNSPYSASKAASDHFVRAYHHTYGLPTLTTNCSNNYGPMHFPEKLIPLIIRNALAGSELPVYGDGLQVRDWLYVADHCAAIQGVLERGSVGETYNVGGNAERTNIEVVRSVCALLDELQPRVDGQPYSMQIRHVKDRPGHDRRYAVDSSRLQRELGWRQTESFESGLRKTVAWYLANQDWVAGVTSGAYRDWMARQYGQGA
jgi:dTDP-glucose 4,6-dehydratase